jgi:hypothetical protein
MRISALVPEDFSVRNRYLSCAGLSGHHQLSNSDTLAMLAAIHRALGGCAPRCCPLLERLGEFLRSPSQFIEQPRVLDGDRTARGLFFMLSTRLGCHVGTKTSAAASSRATLVIYFLRLASLAM